MGAGQFSEANTNGLKPVAGLLYVDLVQQTIPDLLDEIETIA